MSTLSKECEKAIRSFCLNHQIDSSTEEFILLKTNGKEKWLLPTRWPARAIASWRPYSRWSQLKWFVLKVVFNARLSRLLRLGKTILVKPDGHQVAILVGNNPDARVAIIFIAGEHSAILKVGLNRSGLERIRKGFKAHEKLMSYDLPHLPLIYMNENENYCLQSKLVGLPSGSTFSLAHISFLEAVPLTSETTYTKELQNLLQLISSSPQSQTLCELFTKQPQIDFPFMNTITHGDFAPWNLLIQSNGSIVAFDWELSEINGLPLYDLVFFHISTAYHLHRELTWKAVVQFSEELLCRTQPSCQHHTDLVKLALLKLIIRAMEDGDTMLANYAMDCLKETE